MAQTPAQALPSYGQSPAGTGPAAATTQGNKEAPAPALCQAAESDVGTGARALPSMVVSIGNSFFQSPVLVVKRLGPGRDLHSPSPVGRGGLSVPGGEAHDHTLMAVQEAR